MVHAYYGYPTIGSDYSPCSIYTPYLIGPVDKLLFGNYRSSHTELATVYIWEDSYS